MKPIPLLTGRQLVAELSRLGVGDWRAEAVRQWIRQPNPCPIKTHSDLSNGEGHLYDLAAVLDWLAHKDESRPGLVHCPRCKRENARAALQKLSESRSTHVLIRALRAVIRALIGMRA